MSIAIATLAIYIILINPSTYVLFKHGRYGILPWYLISIFCALRIVGAALQIHVDAVGGDPTPALICSSIGLTPLLLGAELILHEANSARNPSMNHRLEITKIVAYHTVVVAALVLVLIGVLNEMKMDIPTPNTPMKIGAIVLGVSWAILSLWTTSSLRLSQTTHTAILSTWEDATILIYAVLAALPFIGLRTLYSILSAFGDAQFRNNQTVKNVMTIMPEVVTVVILVVAGVRTRGLARLRKADKEEREGSGSA